MISRVKGKLLEIEPNNKVIIECDHLSYEIQMTIKDIETLELGDTYTFYTQMIVKEDDISLVGFISKFDKKVYKYLISVSGIGTKIALNIIGELGAKETVSYVISDNIKALESVSGIGKKSASRIVLELKDKFSKVFENLILEINSPSTQNEKINNQNKNDVFDALKNLGYTIEEIGSVLREIDDSLSVEEMLKLAFSKLAMRRS